MGAGQQAVKAPQGYTGYLIELSRVTVLTISCTRILESLLTLSTVI